ncbi:MAG: LPS-assembly protein LptD, partial [Rhodospirillales bacterium]|nr:LPS-assembly protein LptD [Rhodospirillales bacterium]
SEGNDTQRISVNAGWEVPYVAPKGDIYLLSASVRGDGYHVKDLARSGKSDHDGFSERLLYELAMHWRYPLARSHGDKILSVVEPMASVIVSPYGGNPDTIPNEDSQDFEFDDTNLFTANRFPGLDRVEGGPRVNYGLRWGMYGLGGGHSSFLIGQSARLREDNTFAEGSGLEDHISDIVLRAQISPNDKFDLTYRTRLDKEDFEAKRNEVSLSAGPEALRLSSSYVFFAKGDATGFATSREEFRSDVTGKINRYWRSSGSFIYNLESDETQSMGINLIYEDECLVFTTSLRRTFFEDRDIEPTDTILFRVNFKTLGELTTQVF